VKGVETVSNYLRVRNTVSSALTYNPYLDDLYPEGDLPRRRGLRNPAKNDRRIKGDIEKELFWSPFVDAGDINVAVDNGEAELSGTVDSWMEYRAAEQNAYEGGAEFVDNELVVKPAGSEK